MPAKSRAICTRLLTLDGSAETGIAVASVEAARDRAEAAGRSVTLTIYPDAPGGFHADYRASYRKGAAEDEWRQALAFLKSHGVAETQDPGAQRPVQWQ